MRRIGDETGAFKRVGPRRTLEVSLVDPGENQSLQHERSEQRRLEREAAAKQREERAPPESEVTGVMSVVAAVRDVEFPKTIDDLREEVGEREVRTSEDKTLPLRDVLTKLKELEFVGIRDFQTAVQKHWEGIEFLELPEEQKPKRGSRPHGLE